MKPICKTFESGLRVVFTKVGENRPASVYVVVDVGSSKETPETNGISHFVEHLNFKGTAKRTAQQISTDFEDIGANANAWTSKVATCFYATTLPENIENCCEILSDIVLNSSYNEDDIERERKVVFEEISMNKDDPESVAYDMFCGAFFGENSLSLSVLGTKESLSKISRDDITNFVQKNYVAPNIIVSVVGHYDKQFVFDMVEKYFNSKFKSKAPVLKKNHNKNFVPKPAFLQEVGNFNQTQVVIGFPCKNVYAKNKMAYSVLSFIMGGSMGSRLFRTVREEHGLVYSISCIPEHFENAGDMSICFGTTAGNVAHALQLVRLEVEKIATAGVTEEELQRAKTFCKGILLSAYEKGSEIARATATNYATYNKFYSVDQRVKLLENVTIEEVNLLAKETFNLKKAVTLVLNKEKVDSLDKIFE